jgi:hypothetical protein
LVTISRYAAAVLVFCRVGRKVLRHRRVLVLLLALAVPATAQTFAFSSGPSACLPIGHATWRIAAADERADTTVRIDGASPDIRIELTDAPDNADFVLVDDGEASPCRAPDTRIRSVRIDPDAPAPDLVVGLTANAPADYRIYVRSTAFAPAAAAALFAAAQTAERRTRLADHSN